MPAGAPCRVARRASQWSVAPAPPPRIPGVGVSCRRVRPRDGPATARHKLKHNAQLVDRKQFLFEWQYSKLHLLSVCIHIEYISGGGGALSLSSELSHTKQLSSHRRTDIPTYAVASAGAIRKANVDAVGLGDARTKPACRGCPCLSSSAHTHHLLLAFFCAAATASCGVGCPLSSAARSAADLVSASVPSGRRR